MSLSPFYYKANILHHKESMKLSLLLENECDIKGNKSQKKYEKSRCDIKKAIPKTTM